jgi:MFS family permease
MVAKTYEKLFGFYKGFDPAQRRAYWLLVMASAFDGVTQGVFLLQETIAKRALSATDFQISLIGLIANSTMLLAALVAVLFSNRSKKWLLILGLVFGRLIFLGSFLIRSSGLFLVFLLLYHALFAVQTPVLNNFFQTHIGSKRGQAFAVTRMALIGVSMVCSLAAGRFLDIDPGLFPWLLSVVALSGTVTYLVFIHLDGKTDYASRQAGSLRRSLAGLKAVLENREFMMFEAVFMTYGLAFMMMVPAVPLMLLNVLGFTFFQMAQATGLYSQVFIMLILPLAGLVYDRIDLWRLWAASLAVLLGYPLLMLGAYLVRSPGWAYSSLVFYSLGLTGVMVLWNLGSLRFVGKSDSLIYQGFHVTLTGIRGLVGPLLGYLLIAMSGFPAVFLTAAGLMVLAGAMSLACHRKQQAGGTCGLELPPFFGISQRG